MDSWQEDQIQSLLCLDTKENLFNEIARITKSLGFDNCAYGLRIPYPLSRPKTILLNNYSTEWKQRYLDRDYTNIDPTVHHGINSLLPLIWTDSVFKNTREFWEEAKSFNLRVGWSQPCRDSSGICGMLSLSRPDEDISTTEFQDKLSKILWLAQFAHLGFTNLLSQSLIPERGYKLTPREVSVLQWSADGKTSNEISTILSISERTVNFHITNAIEKLGVSNKIAASVKAAMLGLLC